MNKKLSWKLLLPLGAIIWIIFYGGIFQLLGTIIFIMGLIDLFRAIKSRGR